MNKNKQKKEVKHLYQYKRRIDLIICDNNIVPGDIIMYLINALGINTHLAVSYVRVLWNIKFVRDAIDQFRDGTMKKDRWYYGRLYRLTREKEKLFLKMLNI
jgi:hypothetical protein